MEDVVAQLAVASTTAKNQLVTLRQGVAPLPQRLDVLQDHMSHRGYPTVFQVNISNCGTCPESSEDQSTADSEEDIVSKLRHELERAQQRITQLQVEKLEVCKELERKEQLLEEARSTEDKLQEQLREHSKCGNDIHAAVASVSQTVAQLLKEAEVHETALEEHLGLKDQDMQDVLATATQAQAQTDNVTKKATSRMSTILMQATSELAAERQHRKSMQEKLSALQTQLATLQQQAAAVQSIRGKVGDETAEGLMYPSQDATRSMHMLDMDSDSAPMMGAMPGEVVYHTNAFAQLEDACQDLPLQVGDSDDSDDDLLWERDSALQAQLLDLSNFCSANTPRGLDGSKENLSKLAGSHGQLSSLAELLGMAKAVDTRLSGSNPSNPWAHAPLTSRGRPVRPHKSMRDFAGINISNIVSNTSLLAAAQQLSARSWTAGEGAKAPGEHSNGGVHTPRSARSNVSSSTETDRSQGSQEDVQSLEPPKAATPPDAPKEAAAKRDRWEHEERRLLSLLPNPMGFHNGRPLAALAVFYSCLRWKTFQTGRASLLDRIVHTISCMIDQHQSDNAKLAYWLTNTATLWHLLHKSMRPLGTGQNRASLGQVAKPNDKTGDAPQVGGKQYQVEATYPTLVFKQQLDAHVQKIFPLICANVKKQIASQLSGSALSSSATAPGEVEESTLTAAKRQPWTEMLRAFDELLKILKEQFVPKGLVRALFKQLFSYVNVQQFNQLLLRRDCCSFTNGGSIKAGLEQLDKWVLEAGADWVANAHDDLDYIRQAVEFLVILDKGSKTLEDMSTRICPALSINQLYRLATMFWDDQGTTGTLAAEVVQQMKQQLVSGQSGSHAFLLDADTMLTVAVEDVLKLLDDKDFQFGVVDASQAKPAAEASAAHQVPNQPAQLVTAAE